MRHEGLEIRRVAEDMKFGYRIFSRDGHALLTVDTAAFIRVSESSEAKIDSRTSHPLETKRTGHCAPLALGQFRNGCFKKYHFPGTKMYNARTLVPVILLMIFGHLRH